MNKSKKLYYQVLNVNGLKGFVKVSDISQIGLLSRWSRFLHSDFKDKTLGLKLLKVYGGKKSDNKANPTSK